MINLHERMLPTSAGVKPATWSPVGRRIQLSHRGGSVGCAVRLETGSVGCAVRLETGSVGCAVRLETRSLYKSSVVCIRTAPCEKCIRSICVHRRLRTACVSAQCDQGLHCPLLTLIGYYKMNREQMPGRIFAYAQDDLNLHIVCMFKCIFVA